MKKILYVLLASAFLFASCDEDNSNEKNSTPQNNGTEQNKGADETSQTIDFDAFCNIVMGKACGANIDEAGMKDCISMYKAEYNDHPDCAEKLAKYYTCISKAEVKTCAEGDDSCKCVDDYVCKSETDSASACLDEKYPQEQEIDFNAFCNIAMGKACGADVPEDAMTKCVSDYKEEYDTHPDCAEKLAKYYTCASKIIPTSCEEGDESCTCINEDVCKSEIDDAHACLKDKYDEVQ